MNILYISVHSCLEFEETKLLKELGHEVFSLHGSYQNPESAIEIDKRPGIRGWKADQHLLDLAIQSDRSDIHEGFFEWADVILIMHKLDWRADASEWLENVFSKARKHGVTVVWRTIGQSHSHWEKIAKRFPEMKIVRYSPMERNIPDYAGETAMIRFGVDCGEYFGWSGGDNRVHFFGQSLKERSEYCGYGIIEEVTRDLPRINFGTKNAPGQAKKKEWEISWSGGSLSYEDLKKQYRRADVAMYAGSIPASYTLTFIEMMMTGTPLVCLGKNLFNNERFFPGHDLYEIPNIIKNGENGFVSDSIIELKKYTSMLLKDPSLRSKISGGARKTALQLFNKEENKKLWDQFLKRL